MRFVKTVMCTVAITVLLLSGCAASPDGDAAPSVSPPPPSSAPPSHLFEGTANDYAVALAACMTNKNWPAKAGSPDDVEGGSSITYEQIPDDQESAFESDQTDCVNELGTWDDGLTTEAGLKSKYDWYVGQGRCLAAAGYPIPDPPSFATAKDAYETTGVFDMDPMRFVPADKYRPALTACPRSTVTWPK